MTNNIIPYEAVQAAAKAIRRAGNTYTEMAQDALTAALPFLQGVKADPWVDTRLVRFDDTIVFGKGGFDFDRWESLRWEMHTRHGSFAVWKSDSKTWSMYGGKYGFLMLDRFSSEEEAKAEAEQIVISLDAEPSPRAQALEEAHTDDLAVDRFASAMKIKLKIKRAQGRGGWEDKHAVTREYLSYLLLQNCLKGSTLNVANLAMMLHQRGEVIVIDEETASMLSAALSSQSVADGCKALQPDWVHIAKMAGKFGIRYQTNQGFVDFLKAIRPLSASPGASE